jgi:hypothetical protein
LCCPSSRLFNFSTTAGLHTLSATDWSYTWPSKQVTLVDGRAFTDSLPFHCS